MVDEWLHLQTLVDGLLAAGNELSEGGFRMTQGGVECGLRDPLDAAIVVQAVAADARLTFDPDADEVSCRHCWTTIHGGRAAKRYALDYFRAKGFGIEVSPDQDGSFWASLTQETDGRVVAPDYGHGATPEEAVDSARRRYSVEQ